MIGRTDPVDHFAVVAWARRQTRAHNLTPIQASVLQNLAHRANRDGVAWPSIATLADEVGVARQGYRSCTISHALAALETAGLIWSAQAGNGRPARRELLYNPATDPARVVGSDTPTPDSVVAGDTSALSPATTEVPENNQSEEPGAAFSQARTLPYQPRRITDPAGWLPGAPPAPSDNTRRRPRPGQRDRPDRRRQTVYSPQ